MECVRLITYKFVKKVKAGVVKKIESSLNENELIDYCRARLANFKVPKSADFVTELPKSEAGKILKRKLRETVLKGTNKAGQLRKKGSQAQIQTGIPVFLKIYGPILKNPFTIRKLTRGIDCSS
jgi:hypothetical protein